MKSVKTVLSHRDITIYRYRHKTQDNLFQQQTVDNAFFTSSLSLVSTYNASTAYLRNQTWSPETSPIKNPNITKRYDGHFTEMMPAATAVFFMFLESWEYR